jgi:hypothetical protein
MTNPHPDTIDSVGITITPTDRLSPKAGGLGPPVYRALSLGVARASRDPSARKSPTGRQGEHKLCSTGTKCVAQGAKILTYISAVNYCQQGAEFEAGGGVQNPPPRDRISTS